MQVQGLMFAIFMLIIIPMMVLSTNHNAFFLIMALILFVYSIRKANSLLFSAGFIVDDEHHEEIDEIEDELNMDVKRFGIGTQAVKDSIILVFFIYCAFFIETIWFKFAAYAVSLYWINNIICGFISMKDENAFKQDSPLAYLLEILVSATTILLIILVTCNKFIGYTF